MELVGFRVKDVAELLSWVGTEAEMVQWAGAAFEWPLTARQFRRHLLATALGPPTLYAFGLYEGQQIHGYCELSDYRRAARSAVLSRVIVRPEDRGQGWSRSMVRAAVTFGFAQLDLHRIGLGVFAHNQAARRCYAGVGFAEEGVLRDSARVDGAYWSCHLMSLLRPAWEQKRATHDPA